MNSIPQCTEYENNKIIYLVTVLINFPDNADAYSECFLNKEDTISYMDEEVDYYLEEYATLKLNKDFEFHKELTDNYGKTVVIDCKQKELCK